MQVPLVGVHRCSDGGRSPRLGVVEVPGEHLDQWQAALRPHRLPLVFVVAPQSDRVAEARPRPAQVECAQAVEAVDGGNEVPGTCPARLLGGGAGLLDVRNGGRDVETAEVVLRDVGQHEGARIGVQTPPTASMKRRTIASSMATPDTRSSTSAPVSHDNASPHVSWSPARSASSAAARRWG